MRILLNTFLILLVSLYASAQTYTTKNGHAEVKGETSMASYTGVSDELEGNFDLKTGKADFKLRLQSLDTDINLRNKHMLEALEAEKYPFTEFHGQVVGPAIDFQDNSTQKVNIRGTFSIHGESREIELPVTLQKKEEGLTFNASFAINITDYKIKRPKVLFFEVKDKHVITANGLLKVQ